MKLGRNQPCPCGSDKKYKKCCIGKFSPILEDYYGLLQKEGVIKDKLVRWTATNFSNEEMDDFAQKFAHQNFKELMKDKQEVPNFFDWLYLEAIDPHQNKRVLKLIYEEADFFEDEELKILEQWFDNTQAGIYEIQRVKEDECTFMVKELFTKKEYDILDVKGSSQVVRGDVFFARVQGIFSNHYLSGTLNNIPRIVLDQFKGFILEKFEEEKKKEKNSSLSYEDFMNTQGRVVNDFSPKEPEFFTASGEPINICEAVYSLNPQKTAELVDKFAGNDQFLIANENYGRDGNINEAEIVRISEGIRDGRREGRSDDKRGIVTTNHWINNEGQKIPTAGSINIKEGKLTIFSMSKNVYKELKEEVEKNFKEHLKLEDEKIRSIEEVLEERNNIREEDLEENDLETNQITTESQEKSAEIKEIEKQFLEQHYLEWCDMQIPALDYKTPRVAIKTEAGKEKVNVLLMDMENDELRKQKNGEDYIPIEKMIRKELNFYD